MFQELNQFPAPVIASVQGGAFGGAVALLSACDIVIAASDAVFSLSEARLGLIPACAAPFVIAKIGASWTRWLFVTGENISADKAMAIGLVHEVVPGTDDLASAASHVIAQIQKCSLRATRQAKQLVLDLTWPERRAGLENVEEFVAGLRATIRKSPDAQEGMAAFLEKRSPQWATPLKQTGYEA